VDIADIITTIITTEADIVALDLAVENLFLGNQLLKFLLNLS
jgi:hypothetical protein